MQPIGTTRKTYYGSDKEVKNIAIIQARYGLSNDSDVIRFALDVLARSDMEVTLKQVTPVKKRKSK